MGLLDGKVAIVTGAGGGLGRAHALALAKEGAAVVINDLGVSRDGSSAGARFADLVVDEIKAMGGRAAANYDSVATEEGAQGIAKTALDAFGRIDILVNNAGILRDKTFVKSTKEMWDAVIAVHLTGMYLVTHACVPHMQAVGGGSIISTTSLAGLKGNYGQSNYAAAKAGIWGMTHVLAMELGRSGIRANTIAPVAKTRMTEELDMVPDELKPEMVAPMIVYLASDLAKDVTDRCFGCHGPQIFEYVMTTTQGAVRDDGMWTPSEIAARINEIAGVGAAPKAEAKAGPSNEQQALLDEVFGRFGEGFVPERAGDWKSTLHFVIEGAADYTVRVASGKVETEKGRKGDASCVITFADADTFLGVVTGKLRPDKAFMSGKIKASDMGELMKFAQSFDMSAGAKKSAESAPVAKSVSKAALGKKYRVESEFAEPAHIADYVAAVGETNERYVKGGEVRTAPPLFAVRALHRIAMPMLTDPELGADLARLVHGEQDMRFFAPIRPWDVLVPRGEITSIEEKASGTLIRTTQRLYVDGKPVVEAVAGYFVRGPKKAEGGEAKAAAAPAAAIAEARSPLFTVQQGATVEQIAAYAHASTDNNPIHLDDAIAKAAGLPGIIAHGLLTMALATSALVNAGLGGDATRLKRLSVRFARPVLPGQKLTFAGYAADAGRIELDARNEAGEPVLLHAFAEVG